MIPDGSMNPSGSMLEGPLAFTPNASVAVLNCYWQNADGGYLDSFAASLSLMSSNPPFNDCFSAEDPELDSEVDELLIELLSVDPTVTGSYVLTGDLVVPLSPDGGRMATLDLSRFEFNMVRGLITRELIASAIAGTVSVQAVDGGGGTCGVAEMTGSFSATMRDSDGGETPLSGTFDSTLICT